MEINLSEQNKSHVNDPPFVVIDNIVLCLLKTAKDCR